MRRSIPSTARVSPKCLTRPEVSMARGIGLMQCSCRSPGDAHVRTRRGVGPSSGGREGTGNLQRGAPASQRSRSQSVHVRTCCQCRSDRGAAIHSVSAGRSDARTPRIPSMRLWLDADAAPRDVKDVCLRAAERLKLDTVLVANQRVLIPPGYTYVSAVRVDGGPDVADRYIAERAEPGDVAVTADIPLAALLVPKGGVVIDPRGGRWEERRVGQGGG